MYIFSVVIFSAFLLTATFWVAVIIAAGETPFMVAEREHVPSLGARIMQVPGEFEKIQDAINNADDGNLILVGSGTYRENVIVDKSVFLMGMNQSTTIIDGGSRADVVTIRADDVVLSGFTIRNGGVFHYGVKIDHATRNIVQRNIIVNNFVGIKLWRASSNKINWNNITANRFGIFLAWSSGNVVYANSIWENGWNGVELDWSEKNIIEANTIADNKAFGFEIPINTPSKFNVIFHNNFVNNTFRVSVSGYENIWDNDYPSGGNFWDVYGGVDEFRGSDQSELGADGLGDSPYILDGNNRDQYPLVTHFNALPPKNPVTDFTHLPKQLHVNETIAFDASASVSNGGDIIRYFWDFGDGASSSDIVSTHAYTSSGTYTIVLFVIDDEGLLGMKSEAIIIHEPQPRDVFMYAVVGVATIIVTATMWVYFVKLRKHHRVSLLRKSNGG